MSKKNKIQKKSIQQPNASSEYKQATITRSEKRPGNNLVQLISFDKKAKYFLFILLAGYFILSLLKIHTSNIANWDIYFGKEKSESVIAGKPRFIRMDEWMINATGQIGQYELGMPIENPSVGDGKAPVVWNLPVKDISTALRPYLWSYFIFDMERAFAFSYNFNVFFFIISMFLLLMLLTRNNFWLSVAGTIFIFCSGGVQWWSYFISNHMIYLNGMFLSVIYLLYDSRRLPIILSAVLFIFSVYGFIFNLYPPFQVPLIYLYLSLFIGFLWQRKNFASIKFNWQLKAISFTIALIILSVFSYHYYNLVKDTYELILNTVYPGRRFSTGGDLISGKVFAEYFGIFMTDTHTPPEWMNICEASGFIMTFPVVFYCMAYYFIKTKKTDPLLIGISIFLIIGLLYVLVGFPPWLSRLTVFSMSPSFRSLPVIGAANAILLICYIGSRESVLKNEKISWVETSVLCAITIVFLIFVSSGINKATNNFFTQNETWIVISLTTIIFLLIRFKHFPYMKPALYLLLAGMTFGNLSANPLTKGLSPVLENPLYKASIQIHKQDPGARWALYGKTQLTQLLKAAGIDIFNSVKFVPPMKDMKFLDPNGVSDSAYNRYAWMQMKTLTGFADTVVFRKTYNDGYMIFMDPCSPKMKALNIKYIVFDTPPKQEEIRCMTKLWELDKTMFIYKRND